MVEEIGHEMVGAMVYIKVNALKAFPQIHLTKKASMLTTFNTYCGYLRYLHMSLGANMSQNMFQMQMDIILEKCPGVISICDDVVIFGVSYKDHDANLISPSNVCQKEGLIQNSKKLDLQKERVTFFGAKYNNEGIHPYPKKVHDIVDMTALIDKQQLKSFLGMMTYIANLIPNLSHHMEPPRAMLKKEVLLHVGKVTGCYTGHVHWQRCHTIGESQGMFIIYTSAKCV